MLKSFIKLLRNLDFFGKSTTLLFKNDTYYKTNLGFSCSVLLIILSLLGFSFFMTSFLDPLNPMIVFSQIIDSDSLNFQDQQFFIGFTSKNYENDDTIQLQVEMSSNDIILASFPIFQNESCGNLNNQKQKMFCLKISKLTQMETLKSFQIIVFQNGTEKNMSFTDFTIYYEAILINNIDFENPVQTTTAKKELNIVKSFTKSINFELEKAEVDTDKGSISEYRVIVPFYRVKNTPVEIINDKSESLFNLNFEKSTSKLYVARSYMKLYIVLANLGGFMRMLWLIIFVVINPFINILYQKSLINDIFNFNEKEFFFDEQPVSKRSRPSKVNEAMLKLKSFVHVFKSDNPNKTNTQKSVKSAQNKAKNDSPMKEVFKVKETSLEISILESLMYYVCNYKNLRMKKELIKRGSRAINKRIDISYIIQKIVEIEKLKVLLLDADQLKLFEYLPKPLLTHNKNNKLFSKRQFLNKVQDNHNLITLNYFQEKWKQIDEDKSSTNVLEKVTSLFESYQRIKCKENITDIDKKILDMLDLNIKNLLERTEKSPKLKKFITENFSKSNTKVNLKMILSVGTINIAGEAPNRSTESCDKNKENSEENKKTTSNNVLVINHSLDYKNEKNCKKLINFSKELSNLNSSARNIENENNPQIIDKTKIKEEKIEMNEEEINSDSRRGIKKEVLRLNSNFKFISMQPEDENEPKKLDKFKSAIN